MNLYLVGQDVNSGYDTFDAMVVCAESEEEARKLNPGGYYQWSDEKNSWIFQYADGSPGSVGQDHTWCLPSQCKVFLLGRALDNITNGVVLASFNAG